MENSFQSCFSLYTTSIEQCGLFSSAASCCGTDQLSNNEQLEFCPPAVRMLMPWDMTKYLQLLCWSSVSGSVLWVWFTVFQQGSTGTFDMSALHKADDSVAEEQSPRFVCFCASLDLAYPLPVYIASPPKDPVCFPGMFTALSDVFLLWEVTDFWSPSSLLNQWSSSTGFSELLCFFLLLFSTTKTTKTEMIISSYCSQDRNGLPKQSSNIFDYSVLLQRALLKFGLCPEQ